MDIAPNLGIGDLLILKMHLVSNHLTINNLYVDNNIIHLYRLEPRRYIDFLTYLLKKLFPEANIHMNMCIKNIMPKYELTTTYIKDDYVLDHQFNNEYGDYIIFHTKARFDYCASNFKSLESLLIEFFQKFKTRHTILILGERHVEQNKEAITHNITSLYNMMILMKNNNNVIDLTHNDLYSGNTVYDFEKDIFLINNARLNIGFGYGGPLNICEAFSKNNYFYIDKLQHPVLDSYKNINNSVCSDIDIFINTINVKVATENI